MTPTDKPPTPRPGLADALAVASLVAIATAINGLFLLRRPDMVFDIRFLFGEEGINLVLAEKLLGGGLLYRDLSIPYGPLGTYAHVLLASIFGNSMLSFVLYCHAASVVFIVLSYAAIRRQAGIATALFVAGFGLIPTALIPAAPMAGGMLNAYAPMERCIFALAFLIWEPLTRRSAGRSLGLGMVLGLAQWAKFGGALFVGAPIALLDLVVLLGARADRATRLRRLRSTLATALGFLILEGARDLLALAILPRPIALDVIWPGYARAAYRAMLSEPGTTERFLPGWGGWSFFLGQQLNVVAALAVGLLALAGASRRLARSLRSPTPEAEADRSLADFRMLLPLLFYAVGSFQYFGHVFIFMKYYTFIILGAAAWLAGRGVRSRLALGLLWLPAWALIAKMALGPMLPDVAKFPLPDGQSVYLTTAQREDVLTMLGAVGVDPSRRAEPPVPVLIGHFASAFGLFFGLETPSRNVYLIPEYIRPYDVGPLLERFESARALIETGSYTDAQLRTLLARTFDPRLLEVLERREERRVRTKSRRTVILLK